MGFLDDLKRQADAARAQQTTDADEQDCNALLADGACHSALRHFGTLTQQLNVLRPASKVTYRLDKEHVFSALRLCDFRADSRMKRLRGNEVYGSPWKNLLQISDPAACPQVFGNKV